MDGESQLRALERKEQTIGLEGKTLSEEERKKLLRAKEIEESGSIFSEERSDPIFEAAYQRVVARGDTDLAGRSKASEIGDADSSVGSAPSLTQRYSRREAKEKEDRFKDGTISYGEVAEKIEQTQEFADDISSAEEEEMLAEQLSIEQEANAMNNQILDVHREGKAFGKPSKFKYFILFFLAAIVDTVDFAELTGIGYFVAKVVAIICTIIMYLIFWFTNTKQKNAEQYQKKVENFTQDLQKNVAHLERRANQILRLTGKLTGGRTLKKIKAIKTLRKATANVIKITRRNPTTKFLAAAVANLVPGLDLVPWQIVGVWLSYRDELETYKDAATAADDLLEREPAGT